MMENVLTPKEVAKILGVHPYTIHNLLKSGRLKGFRVNSHWRITVEALNEFMTHREQRDATSTESNATSMAAKK